MTLEDGQDRRHLYVRWRGRVRRLGPVAPEVSRQLAALLDVEVVDATHGCDDATAEDGRDPCCRAIIVDDGPHETPDLVARLAGTLWTQLVEESDGIVLHGAAVGREGRAVLLLGPGRVGKSSFAYAAWRAGLEVVGDDRLLLDPEQRTIEALPRPLSVRERHGAFPAGLTSLPADDCNVGVAFGERRATLSRRLPGMTRQGEAFAIDRLILLERMEQPGCRLADVERQEVMRAAIEALIGSERHPLRVLRPLLALWSDGQAWRLQVGPDATEAAVAMLFG